MLKHGLLHDSLRIFYPMFIYFQKWKFGNQLDLILSLCNFRKISHIFFLNKIKHSINFQYCEKKYIDRMFTFIYNTLLKL